MASYGNFHTKANGCICTGLQLQPTMESTLATLRAGPYCGLKLLLAFVGALKAPASSKTFAALCELLVVLELGCIILVTGCRRHRLEPPSPPGAAGIVGLCCLLDVIPCQILLQRLDRSISGASLSRAVTSGMLPKGWVFVQSLPFLYREFSAFSLLIRDLPSTPRPEFKRSRAQKSQVAFFPDPLTPFFTKYCEGKSQSCQVQ